MFRFCWFIVVAVTVCTVAGCETRSAEIIIYVSTSLSFTRIFVIWCLFVFSAAVVAIMKLPVATSNAAVAEAGLGAVGILAVDDDTAAKLGSAGGCEGGWIGRWE